MKKRYRVTLTEYERRDLQKLVSTGKAAAQKLVRARSVLLADQEEGWCLPTGPSAEFVAAMEDVLEVSQRPHDPSRPMVCMDECSKQLSAEVRDPLPPRPGDVAKYDSEDERRGTANIFMAVEPLAGKRTVQVTDQRTRSDWARFMRDLRLLVYPEAAVLVPVMDNPQQPSLASLYEAFDPATALALAARLARHSTPK